MQARIGPNAVLQLIPVLDEHLGVAGRDRLLTQAGLSGLPSGKRMIDEAPVARLHQELRRRLPEMAAPLARQAGEGTGDYIIEHRIPGLAVALLRWLPRALSARLLARAIERHAWTFAGSGDFSVMSRSPLVFEIRENPIVRGERSSAPVCDWHSAVFERLYRRLVADEYRAAEVSCRARGDGVCRFEIDFSPPP
ncbi:MAG: bacteriochlorophyll 4-vinyl reductase [Pseudomonadota bacterium]